MNQIKSTFTFIDFIPFNRLNSSLGCFCPYFKAAIINTFMFTIEQMTMWTETRLQMNLYLLDRQQFAYMFVISTEKVFICWCVAHEWSKIC